jgi:hypothetical protein
MTSSRNLLASLIEQGELTHEEIVVEFNERSRTLREDATLSVRTLRRWLAGDTTWPRPAQRRVAQQYWGRTMVELLGPSVQDPLVAGFQREPGEPASSGIEAQLLMATTRAGQFARMMESGGIGGEGLAILKDDVAHIAAIGETLPAVNVLGGLVELQESIFSVIERGGHRVRDARDLFVAAAMTTAMLSRITQDLGRSHQALSLCRTVYVCADAAEHLALQAWARNEMSLISYRAGSARRALEFAESAVAITEKSKGSTRPWAWSLKARAAAMVQDEEQTRHAITQAREARDSMVPDDLDQIGGLFDFSSVRQTYYAAGALASLPDAGREAEREALEVVRHFESTPGSYATEAGARSELALARARSGEIEGAGEALRPVLALPPERRITGILDSVGRVQAALSTSVQRSSTAAIELKDEIETYRTLSAARAIEAN